MTGLIFDIQRSSFVDGDGVRTTVFFKGCNLKCKWCHNPEGIKAEKQKLFYKSKCTGCGLCRKICQNNEKECTLCGNCALICPNDAKEICGKEYNTGELFEIIQRDKALYSQTGGGVTFSGGECMLQIDFLRSILEKCYENGINTAVDTAGNVPFSYFEKILPYVNTFLYDVKCIDEELHKEHTGVSNTLILENLERLIKAGKRIVVRTPVIGGFNDTDKELFRIFNYLKGKGIEKAELLPYHNMGAHKYEGLSLPFKEFAAPSKDFMEKYKKVFSTV